MGTTKSTEPEPHIQYRKCAKCGDRMMTPDSGFCDQDFGAMSTTGLLYKCPNCASTSKLRDGGSLITGIMFSLASALIGWWAFLQGPWWYATHLSYFTLESYEATFIILDLLAFLFYSGVALFAAWLFWRELVVPVKTFMLNPVTGENRSRNADEIRQASQSRRRLFFSFFLIPLLVYIPLIGGIWLLDMLGLDLRDDEIFKFIGMAVLFAGTMYLAKWLNVSFAIVFFGLVFWMAVFVGAVFTLG